MKLHIGHFQSQCFHMGNYQSQRLQILCVVVYEKNYYEHVVSNNGQLRIMVLNSRENKFIFTPKTQLKLENDAKERLYKFHSEIVA